MTAAISESLLSQLSQLVAIRFGLDFPRFRWHDLERGIRAAYDECHNESGIEAFVCRLLTPGYPRGDLQPLIRHLTVGETYFLRERASFEAICQHIVPAILEGRQRVNSQIRIWSAGCATGEEPYSVAIILDKLAPNVKNVTILATDLNGGFLQRAHAGVYGEWAFRDTPPWLRDRYFEALPDKHWALTPSLKKVVTLREINLMEDIYPSPSNGTQDLDLILCRNVLMYCASGAMKEIVTRFHRCLVGGGWLIVGAAEVGCTVFSGFDRVSFGSLTVYRKQAPGGRMLAIDTRVERPVPGIAPPEASKTGSGTGSERKSVEFQAWYEKAFEYYRSGAYEQAEQMCLAMLSSSPDNSQAPLLLARISANLGHLAEALDYCEKALARDKMLTAAHYLRGVIFEEQGLLDEAAVSLKRAIYADPRFSMGHFSLGNLAARHRALGSPGRHYENTLALLARCAPDELVAESEGISAGELRRIVLRSSHSTLGQVGRSRPARLKSRKRQD